MTEIPTTERMQFFPSIGTILVLSQALCVSGFLLNTNPPLLLHSPGPSNGYDANTVSYLFQKVDRMQLQMQEQNKTIEAQEKIIQQLLNFTQQSPSTLSLSNDLSILQMYVRRIMDEYHRLSNISDATDLALKINSMVNSFKTITSSLTIQENKMTQMDSEFHKFKQELNKVNGTLSSGIQQAVINVLNQSTSTQSLQNEVSILEMNVQRIFDEYHRLTNIANTTHLAEKISSMANTVRGISTSLIASENKMNKMEKEFKNDIFVLNGTMLNTSQELHQLSLNTNSISSLQQSLTTLSNLVHTNENGLTTLTNEIRLTKNDIGVLQNRVSQNQQNVSNQITSLSRHYQNEISNLVNNLHSTESRLSSLQNTVSQNQREISTLRTQYSTVSGQISSTQSRLNNNVTNLDARIHNLEVDVITTVRLVGGSHTGEGRVEVLYKNSWGTVCDDSFTNTDAQVVCRQLGYAWTGAIQKQSAAYGQGSGYIVLDDVRCRGPETSIASCRHNGFKNENCGHDEDVGVVCFSVRLVGGSSSNEGRVVVRIGNTDGTVCDDSWDADDARVVCRMLGYHGTAEALPSAHFGQGSGQIWMDNVSCGGSEESLAKCSSNGFGTHDCSHSEDAGVRCHH